MKQSAAKTLGVAALGAAFAAAGTGAAEAAPGVPDLASTVDGVVRTLPAETVGQVAPGAGNALDAGQRATHTGLTTAQPIAEQVVADQVAKGPTGPLAGLLGGLPLKGLPTSGLPVNGLPLG
ncbi:ATP-binding protein [Streptomyces sp. CRN 30]|uniref:ATP-binding protein n=1 Tax=Streptomyces sp. CRN 30 TaxID=3075613 RepID=UPI002A7F668C|nr:ATP-binding protein [Streptomyces sp. CRN 30]